VIRCTKCYMGDKCGMHSTDPYATARAWHERATGLETLLQDVAQELRLGLTSGRITMSAETLNRLETMFNSVGR
jgi:hypothetical protein